MNNEIAIQKFCVAGDIEFICLSKQKPAIVLGPKGKEEILLEYPSDKDARSAFEHMWKNLTLPGEPLPGREPVQNSTFSEEEEEQMEEYRRSKDKENPDSRNRWAKALGSGHTYDAAKLLDLIRPEVETILVIAGITSPPSQSARVQECLANMEAKYDELLDIRDDVSDPKLNSKQMFELRRTLNVLKAFQAVHKTITLIEGTVI